MTSLRPPFSDRNAASDRNSATRKGQYREGGAGETRGGRTRGSVHVRCADTGVGVGALVSAAGRPGRRDGEDDALRYRGRRSILEQYTTSPLDGASVGRGARGAINSGPRCCDV